MNKKNIFLILSVVIVVALGVVIFIVLKKDRIAPDLELQEVIKNENESYNVKDFVKKCTDNSGEECILEFKDKNNYKQKGTYTIIVVATDKAGNKTEAQTKLIIKETKGSSNSSAIESNKNSSLTLEGEKLMTAAKNAYQMEILLGSISDESVCFSLDYLHKEDYYTKGKEDGYSGSILVRPNGNKVDYTLWISDGTNALDYKTLEELNTNNMSNKSSVSNNCNGLGQKSY